MSATGEPKKGVWASFKRILDTVLATAHNRIELFGVELQEEKCRLVEAMLCAASVAAFGIMTLTLVTFTLVALFWENGGRYPVLIGLSVIYFGVTVVAWRALQARLKPRPPFVGTLGELMKDRSCLESEK